MIMRRCSDAPAFCCHRTIMYGHDYVVRLRSEMTGKWQKTLENGRRYYYHYAEWV